MSSPRIRRLSLDYEALVRRFSSWPPIRLVACQGDPPERYRFEYLVKGLAVAPDGEIVERDCHTVEVNLSLGYPRRAPQCTILTPVFHPNFDQTTVCIGDFWSAAERLDDLVIRIGRMIAYQEYNVKSPLNGLAARWAAENPHLLPVDSREIAPPARERVPPPPPPADALRVRENPLETIQSLERQAGEPEDQWGRKIVIE
ncbi:MAG: ubiquitin-conjugating enzyme E2 [Bryobacterales bacterium]|nr:ubiquitin-conjugating enzyme E2 [Bryobacterales bacterium]